MTLFLFLTKVIICSAAFFGYYFFFLRNKRFHQYNRYYLLIGAALSFLLPLAQIPVLLSDRESENVLIKTLSVITVSGWEDEFAVTPHQSVLTLFLTFKNIALTLYLAGVIILTAYVIKFMLYIKKLSCTYRAEQIDRATFYNTQEPGTPFSFFNAVFWNEKILVSSEKGQQILQHELFHIRAGHSYDIIFMKVITIFFWFNPFYYLFMKEIKAIHEFLADEHASSTADKYDYAELLVTEAINNKNIFLSNPFFHNQIKRRITMLIQHNPSGFSYLRKIMALPLLLILFCAFAFKTNKRFSVKENHYPSVSDTLPASEISKIKPGDIDLINVNKDILVIKFKNGDSAIVKTADFLKADNNVIADTILLDKTMEVKFKNANGDTVIFDTNVRYIANNKVIADTILTDKNIDVKFKNVNGDTVTVNTKVSYKGNDKVIADTVSGGNMIFTQTEAEATYPGGASEWMAYMNKNFKYPKEGIDKKIQGTVIVQFHVDKEGNVSDVEALSGPEAGGLREESIRIIKNSGKWIPAKQNGLAVKSYKKQPITYRLN